MKKLLKLISKISFRLLMFNILLVFLPIAFMFYLGNYEKALLNSQERSMVQQGRVISSALHNQENLDGEANRIIDNLNRKVEARIRIIDIYGNILADSSRDSTVQDNKSVYREEQPTDENLLYSMIRTTLDFIRYFLNGPKVTSPIEYYSSHSILEGVEVRRALDGKYGSTTRISTGEQRSVTLYSALPIFDGDGVKGVVLISQSTYKILQNLYQIRLEIFKIFIITLLIAIVISFIISRTIATPLRNLRNQARELTDNRGRLKTTFKKSKRLDEIGDLNRSLVNLTMKLQEHINKTESFASDVSHEFKNPLASIRSSAELLEEQVNSEERVFLEIIKEEVKRLERLITGVREISLIDAGVGLEESRIFNPVEVIDGVITRKKITTKDIYFKITNRIPSPLIQMCPNKFTQVVENTLSNAISFSPSGGSIEVVLTDGLPGYTIEILDEGPGIPEENLNKIFNRFFSYRENPTGNKNSGLGLSISKSIINFYGGSIKAENRSKGGAKIVINLNTPQ